MDIRLNPNLFPYLFRSAPPGKQVLESSIAGSWYPGNKDVLKSTILDFLAGADAENAQNTQNTGNNCNLLIVPHAGYAYSGPCAAAAFRHLCNRGFRRVILLAPSHHVFLDDRCAVPDSNAVSTPFGEIPVDTLLRRSFLRHAFAVRSDAVHRTEHSTQIQYPFLQCVLEEGFSILPVITGKISQKTARIIGEFLKKHLTSGTAVVVSSDFTHYGRDFGYMPFPDDPLGNTRETDLGAWEFIRKHDAEGFREYIEKNHCTICGSDPIYALLSMPSKTWESALFKYCTSADDGSGDDRFVCYLAGGIHADPLAEAGNASGSGLSSSEKRALLSFARRSIRRKFDTGRAPAPTAFRTEADEAMRRIMGAFVTLKSADGNLRGCIGEIAPMRPLYEAVTERACDSAFRDPRFFPLRADEFDSITIEISALTPPHPVGDWREIEIGKHGMTVSKYGRSAVFLPQVAPEQGWTLEETLQQLCRKAGLAPDDFHEGAAFTVFEAIVFSEDDFL